MSNMIVNTNVLALNSHRSLKGVGVQQSKSSARLSSGVRINSAADDAAGLAISEKMRAQIRGLDMASKNSQDAISLIQTAEGGMQEIDNMLQRIRELTVQASNDTNDQATNDRTKIQEEINELVKEIDSMADRVEFNNKTIINGDFEGSNPTASLTQVVAGGGGGGTAPTGAAELDALISGTSYSSLVDGTIDWTDIGSDASATVNISTEISDLATELATLVDATITDASDFDDIVTKMDAVLNKMDTVTAATSDATVVSAVNDIKTKLIAYADKFDITLNFQADPNKFDAALGSDTASDGDAADLLTSITGLLSTAVDDAGSDLESLLADSDYSDAKAAWDTLMTASSASDLKTKWDNFVTALNDDIETAGDAVEDFSTAANAFLKNKLAAFEIGTPPSSGGGGGASNKTLFFQVGANSSQNLTLNIQSVKSDKLGIGDGSGNCSFSVDQASGSDIESIIDGVNSAISWVTTERAKLGAAQNRLEYTIKSLDISSENLSAAESRIRDTDMAKEMMNLTKSNVLQQAATSMLAQANQAPQSVLQLLQ